MTNARKEAARRMAAKHAAMDLGLAVSAATLAPRQCRDLPTLAEFCGTSKQTIHQIEQRAIAKVRKALRDKHGITSPNQ